MDLTDCSSGVVVPVPAVGEVWVGAVDPPPAVWVGAGASSFGAVWVGVCWVGVCWVGVVWTVLVGAGFFLAPVVLFLAAGLAVPVVVVAEGYSLSQAA